MTVREKPDSFIDWKKGLIDEDKQQGLHPVKRPPEAYALLYKMYLNSFRK